MATATDAQILTLAQWFSPAFPVGGFHFSHGLEAAIDAGSVSDAASLEGWVRAVLDHGSGRSDAILLAASYWSDEPGEVDALARALAPSRERLTETEALGETFGRIAGHLGGVEINGLVYPVAVGFAARAEGLPIVLTSAMFVQAFAASLVSVAQRLGIVGQTEAQAIVQRLRPLCEQIAQETQDGDTEAIGTSAFAADIASMRHEVQYSRVFRT